MKRNFTEWLSTFRDSISDYAYYTDFSKVIDNVNKLRIELNILNSLIGSKNITHDFINLTKKYPEALKCIPLLLAVRNLEIPTTDVDGIFLYNFEYPNHNAEQYAIFMQKTGLFDLLQNHIIHNLIDYTLGIEVGLDSNGRKNRGGKLMSKLVESYIKMDFRDYYKEMDIRTITSRWNLDLSTISNDGKSEKRFDFVVATKSKVYGIETNFYASSGSKLNETARSYKSIALASKTIPGFEFVWFTDGNGWKSARNNLQETFDVMQHVYNIHDLEQGILRKIFI